MGSPDEGGFILSTKRFPAAPHESRSAQWGGVQHKQFVSLRFMAYHYLTQPDGLFFVIFVVGFWLTKLVFYDMIICFLIVLDSDP